MAGKKISRSSFALIGFKGHCLRRSGTERQVFCFLSRIHFTCRELTGYIIPLLYTECQVLRFYTYFWIASFSSSPLTATSCSMPKARLTAMFIRTPYFSILNNLLHPRNTRSEAASGRIGWRSPTRACRGPGPH